MEINQALLICRISRRYVANARLFVHIDGTPDSGSSVALLPPGLSARAGDRIEFLSGHLDPSSPCHYIPPLVSRVL